MQLADIVVGDVTITASRMGKVDFSMPFTDSGWSMVVAVRTETSTSMWIFLQPLTTSLWLASLAFFCFTGFVVWAHYYTTDLSSIAQNAFSLGDFGDRD
jgi:hypothetical protein